MDEIRDYISKEVDAYRLRSEEKENETKEQFFTYLLAGYGVLEFKKWLNKKWNSNEIQEMKKSTKKLINIVDKENKLKPEKTENYFDMISYERFDEITKDYKDTVVSYYKKRKKIADKVPNKAEYLNDFVNAYDKYTANIPYFRKGKVYSWHKLSDYSSMIYNTNLTRSAWNETLSAANETGNTLLYVSSHPYACPKCMEWQGRYYSTRNGDVYPNIQVAIRGGLGHPNCKHTITVALKPSKTQKERYDSKEWEEKYKLQQKLMALYREKEKLKTDLVIYQKLNNQTQIDLVKTKIKRINQEIKKIKTIIDQR